MVTLSKNGAFLLRGNKVIEDTTSAGDEIQSIVGSAVGKEDARKNTMVIPNPSLRSSHRSQSTEH